MSAAPPPSPARFPTLTEVLPGLAAVDASLPAEAAPASTPVDEARIVAQVMAELQRRVDPLLEYRLREALAPALARAADLLIQEARGELVETLRDLVARAVAQELGRPRG